MTVCLALPRVQLRSTGSGRVCMERICVHVRPNRSQNALETSAVLCSLTSYGGSIRRLAVGTPGGFDRVLRSLRAVQYAGQNELAMR